MNEPRATYAVVAATVDAGAIRFRRWQMTADSDAAAVAVLGVLSNRLAGEVFELGIGRAG